MQQITSHGGSPRPFVNSHNDVCLELGDCVVIPEEAFAEWSFGEQRNRYFRADCPFSPQGKPKVVSHNEGLGLIPMNAWSAAMGLIH